MVLKREAHTPESDSLPTCSDESMGRAEIEDSIAETGRDPLSCNIIATNGFEIIAMASSDHKKRNLHIVVIMSEP